MPSGKHGFGMGRITTLSMDEPPRVLESYVAPGTMADIYAAAKRWVTLAEREGRLERYKIEVPGQAPHFCDATAVRSMAYLDPQKGR